MFLTIHVCALLLTLIVVLRADEEAFLWLTGKRAVLDRARVEGLHSLTWAGLIVLILSGVGLLSTRLSILTTMPLFLVKLFFVAVLVGNAFVIGRLAPLASERTFASLSWRERLPLLVSGAVSSMSWAAVIAIALYLFVL